jgi:TolB-like protein/Flp pilus assembly protein TadD
MEPSGPARKPHRKSAPPGAHGSARARPAVRPSFFSELKRRNVIRMTGLYLVASWLIVQVSATILPMFGAPEWLPKTVVVLLAVIFVPALVFSWVYEITPEGIKREREVALHDSITPQTGQRMNRAIVALLVLAVGIFALDKFGVIGRHEVAGGNTAGEPSAAGANSIAVLPLANASGDKDQQYFSDGLSENLIIALSKFDGLTVIGRNSAFQFRDTKEDSKSIGAKLGVAHLLEGSVQRAGDVVRISAELINAANGSTLWSERYDRPYHDLFALQDEITTAVANALKARLLANGAVRAETDRPPSGNLEAYTAFLQGKFYAARSAEAAFRTAIEQFGTATRLDPGYALAWAELSRAWSGLSAQHLSGAAAAQGFAQARAAVDLALKLDPDLAAAHWARGYILSVSDFDWAGTEVEYRRAQQLAPNDGRAKYELGRITGALGRVDEAVALTRSALEVDPLSAHWYNWLARYLDCLGRLDEARQAALKAIELQPLAASFHYQLTVVEVRSGNAAAALTAAEAEPPGPWHDAAVAIARQIGSDRAAADAALKVLSDRYAELGPYQIAEAYAVRKDGDKVFEWLERAWSARDPGIQSLLVDSLFIPYHSDPRIAAFCKKVGLPVPAGAKPAASSS